MTQPSEARSDRTSRPGALLPPRTVGLLSGMMAAFAYLQVMALGKLGEPEVRTVFYFAVGSAVAGGAAACCAPRDSSLRDRPSR